LHGFFSDLNAEKMMGGYIPYFKQFHYLLSRINTLLSGIKKRLWCIHKSLSVIARSLNLKQNQTGNS